MPKTFWSHLTSVPLGASGCLLGASWKLLGASWLRPGSFLLRAAGELPESLPSASQQGAFRELPGEFPGELPRKLPGEFLEIFLRASWRAAWRASLTSRTPPLSTLYGGCVTSRNPADDDGTSTGCRGANPMPESVSNVLSAAIDRRVRANGRTSVYTRSTQFKQRFTLH